MTDDDEYPDHVKREIEAALRLGFEEDDLVIEEIDGEDHARVSDDAHREAVRDDVLADAGEQFTADDIVLRETPDGPKVEVISDG